MSDDLPVAVTDMEGLCEKIKQTIYSELDLDPNGYEYVTTKQIAGLVKEYSLGLNSEDRYMINQENLDDIHFAVQELVVGFMFARDMANGETNCYWDDELNEIMIMD